MFHGKTIGASTPTDGLLWNDKIFVGGRLFIRWEVGGPGVLSHTTTTCEEDLGGQLPRNEYNIPRTSRKKGGRGGMIKG